METHRDTIAFSKFLATIKTDVPITLDLEALTTKEPDAEALQRLFEDLEFRTLLERKFSKKQPTAEPGFSKALSLQNLRTNLRKQANIQISASTKRRISTTNSLKRKKIDNGLLTYSLQKIFSV